MNIGRNKASSFETSFVICTDGAAHEINFNDENRKDVEFFSKILWGEHGIVSSLIDKLVEIWWEVHIFSC